MLIFLNMEISKFDLQLALQKYKAYDEYEQKNLQNFSNFLQNSKEPFVRSNFIGHITGSAYLLSNDLSQVLLHHHRFLNKWLQFGGHSDGDANTLRVAFRETIEESGIDSIVPLSLDIVDIDIHNVPPNAQKYEPAHLHYDVRFIFLTDHKDFKISQESNEIKWFDFTQFKSLFSKTEHYRFAKKWELLLI